MLSVGRRTDPQLITTDSIFPCSTPRLPGPAIPGTIGVRISQSTSRSQTQLSAMETDSLKADLTALREEIKGISNPPPPVPIILSSPFPSVPRKGLVPRASCLATRDTSLSLASNPGDNPGTNTNATSKR
jgi:hypothetical protein